MITRPEAINYLLTLKREYERVAREARERGVADHEAETKAIKFGEISELFDQEDK